MKSDDERLRQLEMAQQKKRDKADQLFKVGFRTCFLFDYVVVGLNVKIQIKCSPPHILILLHMLNRFFFIAAQKGFQANKEPLQAGLSGRL